MSSESKTGSTPESIPDSSVESSKTDILESKESIKKLLTEVKKYKDEVKQRLESNELQNIKQSSKESGDYEYLYPSLFDPEFNTKIADKKEFYDSHYETDIKDVKTETERICNSSFELAPHQTFVRNFLSFLTPYNSLLLYHGLGSGKTCSSISVCEEMREYMKQMGVSKKIIIIASPNVQENFKTQLFDERKLSEIDGIWNLKGCTGNRLLKEINPMNMKGLSKEQVVKQIKKLMKQFYVFMGYTQFSNIIDAIRNKYKDISSDEKRNVAIEKHISREFSNRLIVIDEVHNIRITGDSTQKAVANNLLDVVTYSENLKLLLLSATPMFNSHTEIIFLLNLLNINDKRAKIERRDIFDKNGNFKLSKDGREVGKETFIRKIRGYISFVQGENPYSFPYRVFPNLFDEEHSSLTNPNDTSMQLNGTEILEPMTMTDCYLVEMGEYQKKAYDYFIETMREDFIEKADIKSGMGWNMMDKPLQLLNIVYPTVSFEKILEGGDIADFDVNDIIGRKGLSSVMNHNQKTKRGFHYKEGVVERYGHVFSHDKISNYSGKLNNVLSSIKKSKGVVLIYTQFIDGGCVPIALALEEMGITRYGTTKNLFDKPPTERVDSQTLQPYEEGMEDFNPAKYILISGDPKLSPHNDKEILAATNESNKYGKDVKVIIITRAGSEGIDFKFIRQIHIMEPWYNNNRNEQTIGRAVRFKSHCALPFEERNVEIYLYGTRTTTDEEPIDMYIYRNAEYKSILIGKVSRLIKENAVDCILNRGNTQISVSDLEQTVEIVTSTNKSIEYDVGLRPYSSGCDYMRECNYKCNLDEGGEYGENMQSYNERFIILNVEKLIIHIKDLFRERYTYSKEDLIKLLQAKRNYPLIQIDSALTQLIEDKTEFVVDMFDNIGHIVNIDNYYMFQPLEYKHSKHISQYDRTHPIDAKHNALIIELPKKSFDEPVEKDEKEVSIHANSVLMNITEKIQAISFNIRDTVKERGLSESEQLSRFINYNGRLLHKLDKDFFTMERFEELMIHYYVDRLLFKDKFDLVQYLLQHKPKNKIEEEILYYIQETQYFEQGSLGVYLFFTTDLGKNTVLKTFTVDEKNELIKLTKTQSDKIAPVIQQSLFVNLPDGMKTLYKHLAYTSIHKATNTVVFKVKDMTSVQDRGGARCDQAKGSVTQVYLKEYMDSDDYDELIRNKSGLVDKKKMGKVVLKKEHLCFILEIYARKNTIEKKDGKIWYMTNNHGLLNGIKM